MDRLEKAIVCNLHSLPGLGSRSLYRIEEVFGSFRAFYQADRGALYGSFIDTGVIDAVLEQRRVPPERLLEEYESHNIRIVCWNEPLYPKKLKYISNPPYVLYYRGDLEITDQPCLAIVGSRVATLYGKTTAQKLAKELAAAGMVIVSGLARGIDSEAHRGALEAGRTIAVLGSGLDVIYPPENRRLYQDIMASGAIISEFPLHTAPEPHNFPLRNRIISGLSRGVLVIEAKEKSGALITADFALEQGKDVFALPGPINSKTSAGPNNLIKQGAKLITGIEDILEEYYDINRTQRKAEQGHLVWRDESEKQILALLEPDSRHFDEVLQATGLDIGRLSTLLLKLEMEGIIKSLPGNYYLRI